MGMNVLFPLLYLLLIELNKIREKNTFHSCYSRVVVDAGLVVRSSSRLLLLFSFNYKETREGNEQKKKNEKRTYLALFPSLFFCLWFNFKGEKRMRELNHKKTTKNKRASFVALFYFIHAFIVIK